MTDKITAAFCFRDPNEIADIYQRERCTVIVWGTNTFADQVYQTLLSYHIPVSFFADNDPLKKNRIHNGLPVIDEASVIRLVRPLVIIASYWYRSIYSQLAVHGLKNLFVLKECYKYPYPILLEERRILDPFFRNYSLNQTGKLLVELYGNLGDILAAAGIVGYLIRREGQDSVSFLVEDMWGNGMADFLQIFTYRIYSCSCVDFCHDKEYRLRLLQKINSEYFGRSVSLCFPIAAAKRRILNRLNFNARDIFLNDAEGNYVPGLYGKMVRKLYPDALADDLLPQKYVSSAMSKQHFSIDLPEKYISVGMGASNPIRVYPFQKLYPVLEYFIKEGFHIVFLGFGLEDESYYKKTAGMLDIDQARCVQSYISLLTVTESMYVIQRSAFFFGTESGLWNASWVLGKESVVLYGGGDYGRFKHPDDKIHYVTVDERECFGCNWHCTKSYGKNPAPCIDGISTEKIIQTIEEIIH